MTEYASQAARIEAEARRIRRADLIRKAAAWTGALSLTVLIAASVGIGLGFGAGAGSFLAAHLGLMPVDTN